MTDQLSKKSIRLHLGILVTLIIFSLLGGTAAYYYFEKTGAKVNRDLSSKSESGKVAGSIAEKVTDLTQIAPIMPDAQISSIDTSGSRVNITLESDKTDDEINDYYNNYFSSNGWKESGSGVFTRNGRSLHVETKDGIINIIASE